MRPPRWCSITVAISAYAASATKRSATAVRCLSGSARDAGPQLAVGLAVDAGCVGGRLGHSATGSGRRPRARTWSIALRWAIVKSQLRRLDGVAQRGIGAQRREPRLLVAVVGVDRPDARDQEAVHVAPVRVEQRLEWGQVHCR